MRGARILVAALGCALGLGVADGGQAGVLAYRGTLSLELLGFAGDLAPVSLDGSGVATVNGSAGNGHLGALHLDAGLQTTGTVVVPITDPVATMQGIRTLKATKLAAGASFPLTFEHLGGGTTDVLTDPGGGGGVLPLSGVLVICVVQPDCGSFLSVPLTAGGTRGLGIGGGLLTISGFAQTGLRVSLQANPWTVGTGIVTGIPSANGGLHTVSRRGFVHGPLSATSSTAKPSGVVQLVTPVIVTTTLSGIEHLALFGTLRLHFVPEPGTLLLLGTGAAGLALLARRRL